MVRFGKARILAGNRREGKNAPRRPLRRGNGVWYIAAVDNAPQSLLRPAACPACGRPARELSPCPWCGEAVPADPRTRVDLLRAVAGVAVLALALAGVGTGAPGFFGCFLAGLFLALGPIPIPRSRGTAAVPFAALAAALAGLALRASGTPFPAPFAPPLARILPAAAAALFALRVPAEAPNAPASGTVRARLLRRHGPDLLAAALLLAFAVPPAYPPLGLALVLGALVHRLSRPGPPLLLAATAFALLLPAPAAFAFGILAAALPAAAR